MLGFGEEVLYMLPSKGPMSKPDGNMGTIWLQGTYVGHNLTSNVYSLCTPDKVAEARSLRSQPESERWVAEILAGIKTSPWSIRKRPEPSVTFKEPAETAWPAGNAIPTGAGKMRIDQMDLDNYGYTDRCPQCEHARKHCKIRPGGSRSEACRSRITDCICDADAGCRPLNRQENHGEYDSQASPQTLPETIFPKLKPIIQKALV